MKALFWDVDMQRDFIYPDGKLYIPGAEAIKPQVAHGTRLAKEYRITRVSTGDWHNADTAEISQTPNWATTYPAHCMANTPGATYISEAAPAAGAVVVDWADKTVDLERIRNAQDIVLYKDEFNVFGPQGNPHANAVLEALAPDRIFSRGVATNVCVKYAMEEGLLEYAKRTGAELYVVTDAIHALPTGTGLESPDVLLARWERAGARLIESKGLEGLLR